MDETFDKHGSKVSGIDVEWLDYATLYIGVVVHLTLIFCSKNLCCLGLVVQRESYPFSMCMD